MGSCFAAAAQKKKDNDDEARTAQRCLSTVQLENAYSRTGLLYVNTQPNGCIVAMTWSSMSLCAFAHARTIARSNARCWQTIKPPNPEYAATPISVRQGGDTSMMCQTDVSRRGKGYKVASYLMRLAVLSQCPQALP